MPIYGQITELRAGNTIYRPRHLPPEVQRENIGEDAARAIEAAWEGEEPPTIEIVQEIVWQPGRQQGNRGFRRLSE